MNQFTYRPFYRRNLPHIQPEGAALFVTFRLAGSLPENVKTRNKGHKQVAKEEEDYFICQWDDVLDSMQRSPKYLADHRIANLVAESMHYRDNKFYDLEAFCIMPNHVHIVFTPLKAGDTY